MCGGPPCQGVSTFNRFRSLDDPRNEYTHPFPPPHLSPHLSITPFSPPKTPILRIVFFPFKKRLVKTFLLIAQYLQPPYVMIENVPGMAAMAAGRISCWIQRKLIQQDYQMRMGVLQAGHYGVHHHTTPHQPHHTTPHHTTPHHTTPHHITPHHTTPHHITPHHITPHHTTP